MLFWAGVALAPFAALALLLGTGGGPLRVAAVLAITSVVLMGLSVMLRQDVNSLRIQMEEALLDEVDVLREDIRAELRQAVQGEVVAAMRAVQAAREREVAMLQARVEALQGQIAASPARRRRELPAGSTATADTAHHPEQHADRRTETVQVSARQPIRVMAATADNPPDVPRPRGGHGDTPAGAAGRHYARDPAAQPQAWIPPAQEMPAHPAAAARNGDQPRYDPFETQVTATPTPTRRRGYDDATRDGTTYDNATRDSLTRDVTRDNRAREDIAVASAYHEPRYEAPRSAPYTPPPDPWDDLREDRTTDLGTRRREWEDPYDDRTTYLGTGRRDRDSDDTSYHTSDQTSDQTSYDAGDQDATPGGSRRRADRRADENRYGHLRLVETGPDVGQRREPVRPPEPPPPSDGRDPFWSDPLRAPIPLALPSADNAPTWSQLSNGPDLTGNPGRHASDRWP